MTSDYPNFEPGSITHHLSDLGWQSLKKCKKANTLININKALPALPLQHLSTPTPKTRHMYSTYFILPFSCTNVLKDSCISRAITAWNGLSQSVVDLSDNANAFEAEIKKFEF